MPIDPRRIEVIDDRTAQILRAMKPAERVRRGLEAAGFARTIITAHVRARNAHWSSERVLAEVARRFARG